MYQNKEKIFLEPSYSQLNVAMAHRNYFRRNNLQILKLATYTLKIILGQIGNFLDWKMVKCSYFILSTQKSFTDL